MPEIVDVKMSHDFPAYDEVTQKRLLAEYSEVLPMEVPEGPISYRGAFLSRLMEEVRESDSTARMGAPYNGYSYEQQQHDRPVRIFTRLSTGKLRLIQDALVGHDEDEQLGKVS